MLEVNIRELAFRSLDGGRIVVLRDVSFRVEPGEFVCLFGPSGCGKTTTLRTILGLETSFDGHVRMTRPDDRVASVFQEPRLLPWRTVDQNVRLVLSGTVLEAELAELYDTLGLSAHKDFYPGELSLGLARRAAIARAVAIKPALLVLDEPFVSLDEATAMRIRTLLKSLWALRPMAVVMVTHNLGEALDMADRILFMGAGSMRGDFTIPVPRPERSPSVVACLHSQLIRQYLA